MWVPNLLKREYVALSSRKHRTKRRHGCASSPASSCLSVECVQMMWAFGLRQPFVWLRKTARRSGRSLEGCRRRCGARIRSHCSMCWSGERGKLGDSCQDSGGSGGFSLRFIPRMVQCTFTHVGAILVFGTCDIFWHHGQQQLLTDISEL